MRAYSENERTFLLIIRWSLMTASLIALFWAIYYLVVGSVPAINTISFMGWSLYDAPDSVNRWWSIAIGPIWSMAFILLSQTTHPKKGSWFTINPDMDISYVGTCIVGAIFGLVLVFGFIVGDYDTSHHVLLLSTVIMSLALTTVKGVQFGIVFVLGFGLSFALVNGPVDGFVTILFLSPLPFAKLLFMKRLWQNLGRFFRDTASNFWHWLMVRELGS